MARLMTDSRIHTMNKLADKLAILYPEWDKQKGLNTSHEYLLSNYLTALTVLKRTYASNGKYLSDAATREINDSYGILFSRETEDIINELEKEISNQNEETK